MSTRQDTTKSMAVAPAQPDGLAAWWGTVRWTRQAWLIGGTTIGLVGLLLFSLLSPPTAGIVLILTGLLVFGVGLIPDTHGGLLVRLATIAGYIFLYAPIVILIIFSFNTSRRIAVWEGFTLKWYLELLKGGAALGLSGDTNVQVGEGLFLPVRNSLIVALISTVLSTTLGTLIAIGMERYKFRLRPVLNVLLYLPIIIPDITMGIAMALFFYLFFDIFELITGRVLHLGFLSIILSHVAFNISFVAVVVRARLTGMDHSLEEAAQDAGANEWQTFRHIVLPLIMPGIIGGALLAFTLSLDDYLITSFTAGVGSSTLPMYVYSLVRRSVTPAINALSTLMMAVSITLVTLSLALQRKD
jgi:spermidine/putrescine transport system permease protein